MKELSENETNVISEGKSPSSDLAGRLATSNGNKRPPKAASPTLPTDDQEREGGARMRVGRDYQASLPPMIPVDEWKLDQYPDKALLVWSPNEKLTEAELEYYITHAKEKFGYNAEQALGMLFWHKHDMEKATHDLSNFTPFPDEWSIDEKVLFEQAFQFYGKSFHRIRQMLPDKSIAALVRYYYSWKKTRTKSNTMDRQVRRIVQQKADETAADSTNNKVSLLKPSQKNKSSCQNCRAVIVSANDSSSGTLCSNCMQSNPKNEVVRREKITAPSTGKLLKKVDQNNSKPAFMKPINSAKLNTIKRTVKDELSTKVTSTSDRLLPAAAKKQRVLKTNAKT